MSQTSKPWTSTTPGDAGPYSAEQWSEMYRSFFNGQFAAQDGKGVLIKTGDGTNSPLSVTVTSPATNQVRVFAGEALVNGRHYLSDAQELLTIQPNVTVNARIDRVVLRQTYSSQTIRLAVLQGTAAASPVAPTLTQNPLGTFEISLAQVAVPSGFTTISTGITDERQSAILIPLEFGGTGIDALVSPYSETNLLIADSLGALVKVTATPQDFGHLVTNTGEAIPAEWVGSRPAMITGVTARTFGIGAGGTLLELAYLSINPDSYVTLTGSDQFTLAAGWYEISGWLSVLNTDAARNNFMMFLKNATTNAPTGAQSASGCASPSGSGFTVMTPYHIYSNGTDKFELRGIAQTAGSLSNNAAVFIPTGAAVGSTGLGLAVRKIRHSL